MTQHALISWCEVTNNILHHQIISYVFMQVVHKRDGSLCVLETGTSPYCF